MSYREHELCCGTTCDKTAVAAEISRLESLIPAPAEPQMTKREQVRRLKQTQDRLGWTNGLTADFLGISLQGYRSLRAGTSPLPKLYLTALELWLECDSLRHMLSVSRHERQIAEERLDLAQRQIKHLRSRSK